MYNTKPGGGNLPQPYVPAGNGAKSGEYTNKPWTDADPSDAPSAPELIKLLTKEELKCVIQYTDYNIGSKLNYAIRNNCLTDYGKFMRDSIISAISKYRLPKQQKVFRGIHVEKHIFKRSFLQPYLSGKACIGSEICSTSKDIGRAFLGAHTDKNEISIIFETILPQGYRGLPVENISKDRSEKEILISKPIYKIDKIENLTYNYLKITISILR